MAKTGVLLTGFGGPDSLEAVAPFMCNLMGREPSSELVDRVCQRYLAIGGSSPLVEISMDIATKLHETLAENGKSMPVAVGMAYWQPFIRDALAELKATGCERVVVVSLSPFESKVAHGAYRAAIDSAVAELGGLEIVEAPLVGDHAAYGDFYAGSTATAIMEVEPNEGAVVIFTAHSLPVADLVDDDPYVVGLKRVANEVAGLLGLEKGADAASEAMLEGVSAYGSAAAPRAWFLAFQSKGNRPGEWLGPDLDQVIDAAAKTEISAVVVVPIGFLTDHLETLYDLDIDAAGRAFDVGLEFVRAPVPGDDEGVIKAIADSIIKLL